MLRLFGVYRSQVRNQKRWLQTQETAADPATPISARQAIEEANILRSPERNVFLDALDFKFSRVDTRILKALKSPVSMDLPSSDLKVLKFDFPILGPYVLGQSSIFVRSSFPELFNATLSNHRTLITGNPGIGKSIFQMYFQMFSFTFFSFSSY